MRPPIPGTLWLVPLCLALLGAAVVDIRLRKIPNLLVALLALGGLVHASVTAGLGGGGLSLLGVAGGLGALYWPFSRGLMGAGDVKLLGAIGAWTGVIDAIWVLLLGSILGGVLSLVAMMRVGAAERARIGDNMLNAVLLHELPVPNPSELSRARGIPFGVALVGAAIAVMLYRART